MTTPGCGKSTAHTSALLNQRGVLFIGNPDSKTSIDERLHVIMFPTATERRNARQEVFECLKEAAALHVATSDSHGMLPDACYLCNKDARFIVLGW